MSEVLVKPTCAAILDCFSADRLSIRRPEHGHNNQTTQLGGPAAGKERQVRLLKMFGLAAIVAVVAMAFLGASSASAGNTLLCLTNTIGLTPESGECNPPTSVHYTSVGKGTLLTAAGNIQCEALIQGTTPGTLGAPVLVTVTELNYFNCTATCKVEALTVPKSNPPRKGTLLILKTAAELATVVGHEFEVFARCFFGAIECEYTGTNLTGHGLGPNSTGAQDHVTYPGSIVNNNGKYGGCPPTATLHALFQSLPLQGKIYIRA